MRVVAIIQARSGSTRLPGKVLADVHGKALLRRVIERVKAIRNVDGVVIATTDAPADHAIEEIAQREQVAVFRGSESDVLDRYYHAAVRNRADVIARVTADCPLLDPEVAARVIDHFLRGAFDYVSNVDPPTFPDGLDTEVFTMKALGESWREAHLNSDREHVTPFIRSRKDRFSQGNVENPANLSHLRWTVDEADDLEFIRQVYARMGKDLFGLDEVMNLLQREPALMAINHRHERNEGYKRSIANETAKGRAR